jgi:hypothetical protein
MASGLGMRWARLLWLGLSALCICAIIFSVDAFAVGQNRVSGIVAVPDDLAAPSCLMGRTIDVAIFGFSKNEEISSSFSSNFPSILPDLARSPFFLVSGADNHVSSFTFFRKLEPELFFRLFFAKASRFQIGIGISVILQERRPIFDLFSLPTDNPVMQFGSANGGPEGFFRGAPLEISKISLPSGLIGGVARRSSSLLAGAESAKGQPSARDSATSSYSCQDKCRQPIPPLFAVVFSFFGVPAFWRGRSAAPICCSFSDGFVALSGLLFFGLVHLDLRAILGSAQ